MMGVLVGRPINGVTINGLEYLCDDDKIAIAFEDVKQAKAYLALNGIGEKEIDEQGIIFEEVVTDED